MSLQSRFHNSLLETGAIAPGCCLLVAVSGGADSVALLLLLHSLIEPHELTLEVAHFDHALRSSSVADAAFVRNLCADLSLPLTTERRDVATVAREQKGNLEEVARVLRREFFQTTAREVGCSLIALGHHLDDQAETVLQRLLRGAGTTGLAGMRMTDGVFVRPLLPFSRIEIHAYLREQGMTWREDETNLDVAFTRNRIRHELLPLLQSFNPNIKNQLVGMCEQMQSDDDCWSELVAVELKRCAEVSQGEYYLDRKLLITLASALVGRLVRAALREVRGDLRGITAGHVADVVNLARKGPPQGEISLPGAWVAGRYDRLWVRRQPPGLAVPFELMLPGPGVYALPDGRQLTLSLADTPSGEDLLAVEFSAEEVTFPLFLRRCQHGDRLHPSGMTGSKKLQDLFVDAKLSREERQSSLLLIKDEVVLWVIGMRRCEGARAGLDSPVLRLVVEPLETR